MNNSNVLVIFSEIGGDWAAHCSGRGSPDEFTAGSMLGFSGGSGLVSRGPPHALQRTQNSSSQG